MFRLTPVIVVVTAVVLGAGIVDAGDRIFDIKDPSGDSYGDGSFLYPQPADIEPNDLDIVRFRAFAVSGGTEFEATFVRPIKEVPRRPTDGFLMITDLATLGFYNFNIDVYIDIDREPGSGRVATLPGRVAEVHADHAWEKVVCLTPRPDTARSLLRRFMLADAKREMKAEQGTVRRGDMTVAKEQIKVDVSDDTYFPTRVRVSGPKIRFFVPNSFLGQTARPEWSYTVVVSGADLLTNLNTQQVDAGIVELQFSGLMIVGIRSGGSRYTFGSREPDVEMLPPLPDIVVPTGADQEAVLRSFDVLAERKAQLLGVVPAG